MKEVCRDFTICMNVPDDVNPEECDIGIITVDASYKTLMGITIPVSQDELSIIPEEPYEHE